MLLHFTELKDNPSFVDIKMGMNILGGRGVHVKDKWIHLFLHIIYFSVTFILWPECPAAMPTLALFKYECRQLLDGVVKRFVDVAVTMRTKQAFCNGLPFVKTLIAYVHGDCETYEYSYVISVLS